MGIEYYLFAAFVFGLAAVLVWMIVKGIRKGRTEETQAREQQEKKLQKMYDEVSDLLEALEVYVEESRADITRTVQRAHESLKRPQSMPFEVAEEKKKEQPQTIPEEKKESDGLYVKAMALQKSGITATQIAEQLGISKGEVNLMLSLRGRGNS